MKKDNEKVNLRWRNLTNLSRLIKVNLRTVRYVVWKSL
jgi:hypothetical protein